jgi:two-component system sensor histidine kinase DesK
VPPSSSSARSWIDRVVEPSFALRGAALAIALLEFRAALAALTGAGAEPYDGLIVQLWRVLGGNPLDRGPLVLSLTLLIFTSWSLWRLAQPQHIDQPPPRVLAWLLGLDLLAFAVTPGLAFLVTVLAGLLLRARWALAFAAMQVLLAVGLHLLLPSEAQRLEAEQIGWVPALFTQGLWMVALHGLGFGLGRLSAAQAEKRRWMQAMLAERLSADELHDEQLRYGERLELARELHDLMGHHLTALNLQLQLGQALLAREQSEGAAAQLEKARGVAELLLADVRQAVSAQRAERRIDLSSALQLLANSIDTPVITLGLDDAVVNNLPPRQAHALLRSVQEAVTNCVRHARARHLHVQLQRSDGELVVRIEDDGEGQAKLQPGNGLTGMNERLQELGGSAQVLRHHPGFLIELRCPLEISS